MPVFDMIEQYLVEGRNLTPGRPLRIIARSLYVGKYNFSLRFAYYVPTL